MSEKAKTKLLRELLGYVKFERASFKQIGPSDRDKLPQSEDEVDAFIKRRTDLYMRTWVIPKLEKLLTLEERVYAVKLGDYYMAAERGHVVPLVHPKLPVSKDRALATHFANRDEAQIIARSCGAKLIRVSRRRKLHGGG